ncbi:MAG: hypothetical protein FWC53_02395 [Firmicutes bacterium]|nr:hypothetical protein [Bacillota bacterium]
MICQNCGENEANVRYTQIINGNAKEMVLCSRCAGDMGIDHIDLNMPIDLSSFFADVLGSGYDQEFMPSLYETPKELKCDVCSMTYDEFVKLGKFGCANCYTAFADRIDPILKRIHGNNIYLGRKCDTSNAVGAGSCVGPEGHTGPSLQRKRYTINHITITA